MENNQAYENNAKEKNQQGMVDMHEYIALFHHLPPFYLYFTPLNAKITAKEEPVEILFDYRLETAELSLTQRGKEADEKSSQEE